MRLLLIEDEPAMQRGLLDVLEAKGYEVAVAARGDDGLAKATEGSYDLILLDVMLPGISGFDVLRRLRQAGDATPVILLTAKSTEVDKVLGFELGVDDYVTKPFSMLELLGRVGAVLRRAIPPAPDQPMYLTTEHLQFGTVDVDLRRYRVTRLDQPIDVPAKAIEILKVLACRHGEVVSRDALIDAVWGVDEFINHRTVNNLVVKLRQVIEPEPDQPIYLKTVHGLGYRLDLPPA